MSIVFFIVLIIFCKDNHFFLPIHPLRQPALGIENCRLK